MQKSIGIKIMNALTTRSAKIAPVYRAEIAPSPNFSDNWRTALSLFLSETDCRESTKATYFRSLSHFFEWIETSGRSLPQMQRADILEYKNTLQRERLSTNTINGYLVAVRQFYTWTETRLYYPNIASGIKTSGRQNKFIKEHLPEGKISALLDFYKSEGNLRDYALVNLMLRTGLRTIEVARLQVKDLTLKGEKRVLLVRGKGHSEKEDFVIISPKAYEPIKEYLATRGRVKGEEALFANTSRNRGYYDTTETRDNLSGLLPDGLSTRTISGICKRGLVAVGLDSSVYTAHSLRHTTAVTMISHGVGISEVQEVLRHGSIDTTRIYLQSIQEEDRLRKGTEELLDKVF